MNREETREAAEVMMAWAAGKPTQLRYRAIERWSDMNERYANWNFVEYDYRIKPEPREWWIRVGRANVSCNRLGADVVDCDKALEPDGNKWVLVREVMENE